MAVVDEYSAGSVAEPTVRALWDAISGELLRQDATLCAHIGCCSTRRVPWGARWTGRASGR
jgi:hypothetical protein